MTETELLELKERINKSNEKVIELKAQEKYLKKSLKDDWDCETVGEAKRKVMGYRKDLEKVKKDIERKTVVIEKELEVMGDV